MRILPAESPPGPGTCLFHDVREGRWLLLSNPAETVTVHSIADVLPALGRLEEAARVRRQIAAGWIAYEAAPAFDSSLPVRGDAGFPLLWFGLYNDAEPVGLPPAAAQQERLVWVPTMTVEEYRAAFATIREEIRAGNTYQVNLTFRLRTGNVPDPWQTFLRLVAGQAVSPGAFVHHPRWILCSSSPELFLESTGPELVSEPMKGTRPRGLWTADDLAIGAELQDAVKDRAENVMIADMVRNDLGRIALPGSVRTEELFALKRLPTVWQMVSKVRCTTSCGLTEVLRALFPPASITGAPKASTMDIIRRLETTPRRVYTGAMGFILPEGRMQFNVAIRTLLVDKRTGGGEYGVGSGVVWRSAADAEYEECLAKSAVLTTHAPRFSLIETMRWEPGRGIALLDRHMRRLRESAEYFGYPFDRERIRRAVESAVHALCDGASRIRLLLDERGEAVVEAAPAPDPPARWTLRLADRPLDSRERLLYHKTTYRKVYEEALDRTPGCDDVLLFNERGEATESCIANLIVDVGGTWYTPPLSAGVLPGVYRSFLLDEGRLVERVIPADQVHRADRILLCNALRGVWRAEIIP